MTAGRDWTANDHPERSAGRGSSPGDDLPSWATGFTRAASIRRRAAESGPGAWHSGGAAAMPHSLRMRCRDGARVPMTGQDIRTRWLLDLAERS